MITVFNFDKQGPPDAEIMIKDLIKIINASKPINICSAAALVKFRIHNKSQTIYAEIFECLFNN